MDLLLWRHAEAVDGVPDSTRELSERGLRQAHKMAEWLDKRRHEGRKLTFLIGGPEGIPGEVSGMADHRLSLGPQTMAHQLARVVLLEQLFRASKILAGQKYHL